MWLVEKIYRFKRFLREQKALQTVASHKGRIFISGKGPGTKLTYNTFLGDNVNFNGLTINGKGKVVIGDNFHSGVGCLFITQNHNYNGDALPYDDTYVIKNILIGDNVWLGDRVIILGGVTIGEGAIVQAGAVVVNDIPPLSIAGGSPAKVFKQRNVEHYFKLKEQKKFH